MTTRHFDPVFSAALRNELEALADRNEAAAPARRPVLLARPQVWVALATALVLIGATIGVLRVTAPPQPAATPHVVSPLSRVTDPHSPLYVARSVRVLLDARGVDTGTRDLQVPADVTSMRIYLSCSGTKGYSVEIDHQGGETGSGCDPDTGSSYTEAVQPGDHTVTVRVAKGVAYALTIIEAPAPTIATGALIDPLAAIRDRRTPDALVGDTRVVLASSGIVAGGSAEAPNHPDALLRAYYVCRTSTPGAQLVVDGHVMRGCMNSVAHWLDFTPSAGALRVRFDTTGDAAFLVVRAPAGATASPATTTLPYPEAPGTLLAEARGNGAPASGSYTTRGSSVLVTATCRGTGWLEIQTGQGGTTTRGERCSTVQPLTVGFGGDATGDTRRPWSVIPHGDISWTFRLTTDG